MRYTLSTGFVTSDLDENDIITLSSTGPESFSVVWKTYDNLIGSDYWLFANAVGGRAKLIPVDKVSLGGTVSLPAIGDTLESSTGATIYLTPKEDYFIGTQLYRYFYNEGLEIYNQVKFAVGDDNRNVVQDGYYPLSRSIVGSTNVALKIDGERNGSNISVDKLTIIDTSVVRLYKWGPDPGYADAIAGASFFIISEDEPAVLQRASEEGYNWEFVGEYYPIVQVAGLPDARLSVSVDEISVSPENASMGMNASQVFTISATKDGSEVEGVQFEISGVPSTLEFNYPFNGDYSKFEIRTYNISSAPEDFIITVSYEGLYATADVHFYGNSPYNPSGSGAGGGAGQPSGTGGGGGTFPSDPGPSLVDRIPNGQTGNDISQSGLFTMYLMNQQYMNLMGEILWEDNIGIQVAKEIFGNPINTVISTISYPFNLLNLVQYAAQNLYFGQWKTDLIFQALTKSSFQIDWGTISIPFAWGNFLDYAPHTKMELFLPWGPGYVTIDPNEVSPFSNEAGNFNVGSFTAGSIQVKTNIELGKGTCVHNVIGNNGRVIGSYSGIVGKQVPITALDTGGKALTTIAAVSTIVGGVVAGSLAAKGAMDTGRLTGTPMKDPMRPFESASYWDTGMISGRASAQNLINTGHNLASRAINSTPITFPRAGTFSDGSSAMTVQTPFLIISRPVQSVPTQYGHYNGYPSNIHYFNFSNISGYTEISEIHLDNVTATADELQELDAILKGGILL